MSFKAKQNNLSTHLMDEEAGPKPSDPIKDHSLRPQEKVSLSLKATTTSSVARVSQAGDLNGRQSSMCEKMRAVLPCLLIVALIGGGIALLVLSYIHLSFTDPNRFTTENIIGIGCLTLAVVVMKGPSEFVAGLIEKKRIVAAVLFLGSIFGIYFTNNDSALPTQPEVLNYVLAIVQIISGIAFVGLAAKGKGDPTHVKSKPQPKTVDEIYDAFG